MHRGESEIPSLGQVVKNKKEGGKPPCFLHLTLFIYFTGD